MSRSRRRTPKRGVTVAESEKREKTLARRRLRRRVHVALRGDLEAAVLPHQREVSDPWAMAKDGKLYLGSRAARRDLQK